MPSKRTAGLNFLSPSKGPLNLEIERKKMKKVKQLIVFFSVVLLTSCTSVKISTIKNQDKKVYNHQGIVICSNSKDIEFRTTVESKVKDYFEKYGKRTIQSIKLFPPLREYSITEIYEISKENNYDSILFISSLSEKQTGQTGYVFPFQYYFLFSTSTSYNSAFDVQLIDVTDSKAVLHSTVKAEGDSLNTITKSISKKIVSEILTAECNEYIHILQELFEQDLKLIQHSDKNYSIMGRTKLGDLRIKNNKLILEMPLAFSEVNDSQGLIEKVFIPNNPNRSHCRITTNNRDDLEYIVSLLEEYNLTIK